LRDGLLELASQDLHLFELRLRRTAVVRVDSAVEAAQLFAELLLAGQKSSLAGGHQRGVEAVELTGELLDLSAQLVSLGKAGGALPQAVADGHRRLVDPGEPLE